MRVQDMSVRTRMLSRMAQQLNEVAQERSLAVRVSSGGVVGGILGASVEYICICAWRGLFSQARALGTLWGYVWDLALLYLLYFFFLDASRQEKNMLNILAMKMKAFAVVGRWGGCSIPFRVTRREGAGK